jgi:ABC-type multidrug transport system fused ATPase/permease subunit
MKKGYIQVYTGNGKGKTTAALGISLRAVCAGKKVYFAQFVKGMKYSELDAGEYLPNFFMKQYGRDCFIYNEPEDDAKNTDLCPNYIVPSREDVKLSFNNVTFQYEEGADILQNISLSLKPQEKVTFVGRTGVGKTTLFKLVMGFLKPVYIMKRELT